MVLMKNYDLVTNECCGSGQVSPHSSIQTPALAWTVTKSLMEVVLVVVVVLELPLVALGVRVDVLLSINL